MASLQKLSACVGLGGSVSILGDFFEFFRRLVPPDPTGAPITISLSQQIQRLKNPHFHLNVTAVGVESFTDGDNIDLDYAIFKIRNMYAQVGVLVGRVLHFSVPVAQANGLDSVTTTGDTENLSNRFVVHNDGIDVHVPFSFSKLWCGPCIYACPQSARSLKKPSSKGTAFSVLGAVSYRLSCLRVSWLI